MIYHRCITRKFTCQSDTHEMKPSILTITEFTVIKNDLHNQANSTIKSSMQLVSKRSSKTYTKHSQQLLCFKLQTGNFIHYRCSCRVQCKRVRTGSIYIFQNNQIWIHTSSVLYSSQPLRVELSILFPIIHYILSSHNLRDSHQ
jgi:hypothetical protein